MPSRRETRRLWSSYDPVTHGNSRFPQPGPAQHEYERDHHGYVVDNKMVFDKLAEICCTHSCWTYIKPFLHRHDVRSAFLALVNHFLDPNNIDNMAAQAEQKLMNTTYRGETRRWSAMSPFTKSNT